MNSLLNLIETLLSPGYIFIYAIIVTIYAIKIIRYKNTSYYQVTKVPYFSLKRDIGKYGEYLVYMRLKKFEQFGAKFLFNTYIPKENGETSEIDILMISSKGIFVIESKNYSGWIFGNDTQNNWYQTLPVGVGRKSHKEIFYNPVKQNQSHIKHLEKLLDKEIPLYSVIVFSERCTLKNVEIMNDNIQVINRQYVFHTINDIINMIQDNSLSTNDILSIYNLLLPYSQVDSSTKSQHITNININLNYNTTQKNKIDTKSNYTFNNASAIEENHTNITHNITQTANNNLDANTTNTHIASNQPIICPLCGGKLIKRTANKGINVGKHFYGCSNYPKCKYTKNITENDFQHKLS